MSVFTYEGYKHELSGGDTIAHKAVDKVVLFALDWGPDEGRLVRLTVGEARRLATSLLRDVALIEDGSG